MRPLDPDFDIPDIIGRQLNQIGVGKWDAQFCFDGTRIIQSTGKVDVSVGGKTTTLFTREWLDLSPIQTIMGLDVTAWKRLSDYSFSVTLTDGSEIIFYCTDSQYEDIIIHPEMWVF